MRKIGKIFENMKSLDSVDLNNVLHILVQFGTRSELLKFLVIVQFQRVTRPNMLFTPTLPDKDNDIITMSIAEQ